MVQGIIANYDCIVIQSVKAVCFRRGGEAFMAFQPLPIGIDDFEKIIADNYYYVDKTLLIKELIDKKGEVNLFMRPRRFGKTLNMSMLQNFFEDTGSQEFNEKKAGLFAGMKIMDEGSGYLRYMNQYPTISLSLKSAKQPTWDLAYECMKDEIRKEFKRHRSVMDCLDLEEDKRRYCDIMNLKGRDHDYVTSIQFLMDCLYQAFQKPTVILIDEYDVPLENAYFSGFYQEMVAFIRSLFESALKTNAHLAFAVITGCLRITKESIFTGLNNLEMISILESSYDEYFGFTQEEIDDMLRHYHLEKYGDILKKWYNGYLFGKAEVYNPWSVANYVKSLCVDSYAFPLPYWANTSSNLIVRNLVERANISVKGELETLLSGNSIEKAVQEDITYDSVYDSDNNLWTFLFFTGYLKQSSQRLDGRSRMVTLKIPNEEVAYIYENTITNWFQEQIKGKDFTSLYQAMLHGDSKGFQTELARLLQESISYMDGRENFYHGFLLGILSNLQNHLIRSNREAGDGRLDIVVRSLDVLQPPVILELKVSDTFKGMEPACRRALEQINLKSYDAWIPEEGYTEAWLYGIAFYRKQCLIYAVHKVYDL